jgi:hypothetical protein
MMLVIFSVRHYQFPERFENVTKYFNALAMQGDADWSCTLRWRMAQQLTATPNGA